MGEKLKDYCSYWKIQNSGYNFSKENTFNNYTKNILLNL